MLNPNPFPIQILIDESQKNPDNVSFKYLYRDASNYKLHGEAVFSNTTFISIEDIEKQIRSSLGRR